MAITSITHSPAKTLNDYLSLTKPRSILPHFVTAAAAMILAVGGLPSVTTLVFTLLGGGIVAASANVFNSFLDRDIDALMVRTQNRPLPAGRLGSPQALVFGVIVGSLGILILVQLVNWISAALAAVALTYYILPYTLWLKRRTQWSTITCSGIGAIPPLIGWTAVTNRIEMTPILLSGIIILWTMPHFWSLAIFRRDDYLLAGLKVIPGKHAATWTVIFSILLAIATILLALFAGLGSFYLLIALILAIVLLGMVARLMRQVDNLADAKRFYIYSIVYIVLLFGAIVVDRLIF